MWNQYSLLKINFEEILGCWENNTFFFPHKTKLVFLESLHPSTSGVSGTLSLAVHPLAVLYFFQWLSNAKMHKQILHVGPETRYPLKPEALLLARPQSQTLPFWISVSRLPHKDETLQEVEAVWSQLSFGCLLGYGSNHTESPQAERSLKMVSSCLCERCT